MKNQIVIVSIVVLFLCSPSQSQWQKIGSFSDNQLYGLSVQSFAVKDSNFFAGTLKYGIYLSTDLGTNWTAHDYNLPVNRPIISVVTEDSNIFAALDREGVFLSTDNGRNWSCRNNGLDSEHVFCLTAKNSKLYAGTTLGLFISSDNGNNWNRDSMVFNWVTDFIIKDRIFYVGTLDGIFNSTDEGDTWTKVEALGNKMVNTLAVDDSNIFVGTNYAVFHLIKQNNSWVLQDTSLVNVTTGSLLLYNQNIFAGTIDYGVFISTDNGKTWSAINSGLGGQNFYPGIDVYCFTNINSTIFIGTSKGVFFTTDNGTNWNPSNIGLTNVRTQSVTVKDSTILAAKGPIYRSFNYGNDWTISVNGMTDFTINVIDINEDYIYAGGSTGIAFSTDYGDQWFPTSPLTMLASIHAIVAKGAKVFAGANNGIYFSSDNAGHWETVNNGLTNKNVSSLALSDTIVFAGTPDGVFRSTNNGTIWDSVNIGLSNKNIYSLASDGSNIFAGTTLGGIFHSTDHGTSWMDVSPGIINSTVNTILLIGKNIFVGTSRDGIFLSKDNGMAWGEINSGLTHQDVYSLATNGSEIFAGIYCEIWHRSISELITDVKTPLMTVPNTFELEQNYPNPFNPTTTIVFKLPNESKVQLKVFDTLGREITTLVNGVRPAGTYKTIFDGNNLASGVYIYRLTTENNSFSKKLILLK